MFIGTVPTVESVKQEGKNWTEPPSPFTEQKHLLLCHAQAFLQLFDGPNVQMYTVFTFVAEN